MTVDVTPAPAPTLADIELHPDRYTEEQKAAVYLAEIEKMSPREQKRILMHMAGIPEEDEVQTVIKRGVDGKLALEKVSLEDAARLQGMGLAGYQSVSFTNRRARRRAKIEARRAKSKPPA